jgi:pimeloyl-ACP methyl ester carboxylesterase
MIRGIFRWTRAHRLLTCCIFLALLLITLNLLAYMQARSMTHFVRNGARTNSPEQLTLGTKLAVLLTGVTVPRPENHRTPADYDLPFVTHRISSSEGIELELWHVPARTKAQTLLVCFHSYASSKQMLLPVTRQLHDMGYAVLLVDFRGSGGSSGDDTTIGYREAEDVIAATKFARGQFAPERVILFGESMGATAVLRAASLEPQIADSIIVAAPFDRLLSTVENRFVAMRLPPFMLARLICFWGGVRQGYWAFDHNPSDYATRITCPVLHLHGENDPRVTLAQARDLFRGFAGPKQLVLFSGAGHSSLLEIDRDRWTRSVRQFIESPADLR